MSEIIVSVIIPVYNDTSRLFKCLSALNVQSGDVPFEVIVIDNGSSEPSAIEKCCSPFKFVRLATETEKGSYKARNKGLCIAQGNIIAFTDSDCIPDPSWIAEGVAALKNESKNVIVAGDIKVFSASSVPNSIELYEQLFAFQQRENVRAGHCVTANLFLHRKIFEDIGVFNAETLSGGDVEFCKRASRMGKSFGFAEHAVVLHPARASWKEYRTKIRRIMGGAYKLRNQEDYMAEQFTFLGLLRLLIPPVNGVMYIARRSNSLTDFIRIASVLMMVRYYGFWIKFLYKFKILREFERK
ncbi:hypothetical protein GCM10009092_17370 [Bowmanella denitrificans]|uniref:Glycosyltransferase 2-like domain-containing protein n=1 Tax=Bowmanella denitrificans TaxID=366582 RepID=A0ABP3GS61_9ALTE